MWRLLKRKLPLDDNMVRFGITLGPNCLCCRIPTKENVDQVILNSNLVRNVWHHISQLLGINFNENTLINSLWQWWNSPPKNRVHQFILFITPSILSWEVWKARYTKRYDQRTTSTGRTFHQILFQVKVAMGKKFSRIDESWNWRHVCWIAENYKPRISSLWFTG